MRDLLTRQLRHLFCHSVFGCLAIILIPAILVFNFFAVSLITKDKNFPTFKLEKLKHPVYNMAYLHDDGEFYADFGTSAD